MTQRRSKGFRPGPPGHHLGGGGEIGGPLIAHRSHLWDSDTMPTPVSVVVLNFNRDDELKTTVAAVVTQSHRPLEVIVVDNASRDGSVDMVRSQFPSVRVLALS